MPFAPSSVHNRVRLSSESVTVVTTESWDWVTTPKWDDARWRNRGRCLGENILCSTSTQMSNLQISQTLNTGLLRCIAQRLELCWDIVPNVKHLVNLTGHWRTSAKHRSARTLLRRVSMQCSFGTHEKHIDSRV